MTRERYRPPAVVPPLGTTIIRSCGHRPDGPACSCDLADGLSFFFAFVLVTIVATVAALVLHGCSAPRPLPTMQCSGDHAWVGNVEYQCLQDPTAYPVDPAGNIARFEAHAPRADGGTR